MRRSLVVLALTLTIAGTAGATLFPADQSVFVNPPEAGKGSEVGVGLRGSAKSPGQLRGFVLRLARGFRFNPAAVATRCKVAEAAETNSCPADSRIGGGEAHLTLDPGGQEDADVDLFLAPRQHAGDAAGIVAIADLDGRKGHALGRVQRLDPDVFKTYGLQISLDPLRPAFRPPKGAKAKLKGLNLVAGAHRTVDGKRRDLIRNPACSTDGWEWELLRIHPQGDRSHYYGTIECYPTPQPGGGDATP